MYQLGRFSNSSENFIVYFHQPSSLISIFGNVEMMNRKNEDCSRVTSDLARIQVAFVVREKKTIRVPLSTRAIKLK